MPRPVFAETVTIGGRWRRRERDPRAHVLDARLRDVPLREHDDRRVLRLARDVGDREILVDEALARVDEDERHVGALGGSERPQLRVVLDPLPLLALAADPRGVDEHERAVAALQDGVDRVARRARASRRRSRAPRRAARSAGSTCRRSAGRGSRPGSPPRPPPAARCREASSRRRRAGRRCRGRAGPRAAPGRRGRAGGTRTRARPGRGSSILFASSSTGLCARRRIAASSSSPGVIPARASTTNRIRSASAIAARAWSAIERVIGVGSAMSTPPVSISRKRWPFQSATTSLRSRVTPGVSCTTAARDSVSRLTSVDLPTFGKPTTATVPIMGSAVAAVPHSSPGSRRVPDSRWRAGDATGPAARGPPTNLAHEAVSTRPCPAASSSRKPHCRSRQAYERSDAAPTN